MSKCAVLGEWANLHTLQKLKQLMMVWPKAFSNLLPPGSLFVVTSLSASPSPETGQAWRHQNSLLACNFSSHLSLQVTLSFLQHHPCYKRPPSRQHLSAHISFRSRVMAGLTSEQGRILLLGRYSDLTLVCKEVQFKVHKSIVCVASRVIDQLCSTSPEESVSRSLFGDRGPIDMDSLVFPST